MIEVTKLDGSKLFVNEMNIQWIESLPDTAITFLGGARVIVRDTPEEIAKRCNGLRPSFGSLSSSAESRSNSEHETSKS
jgi:flagellar protein FlbD